MLFSSRGRPQLDAWRRDSSFFHPKSQPRTGHTREPDPTHNELKHTATRKNERGSPRSIHHRLAVRLYSAAPGQTQVLRVLELQYCTEYSLPPGRGAATKSYYCRLVDCTQWKMQSLIERSCSVQGDPCRSLPCTARAGDGRPVDDDILGLHFPRRGRGVAAAITNAVFGVREPPRREGDDIKFRGANRKIASN